MEKIKKFNEEKKVCQICGSIMRPHGTRIDKNKEILMEYVCKKCHKIRNINTNVFVNFTDDSLNTIRNCSVCGDVLNKDGLKYHMQKNVISAKFYCKSCKKKCSDYITNFIIEEKK